MSDDAVQGEADSRFSAVREVFADQLASGAELGAAIAVDLDGAVEQVPCVPDELEPVGLPCRPVPEPDALHGSGHASDQRHPECGHTGVGVRTERDDHGRDRDADAVVHGMPFWSC